MSAPTNKTLRAKPTSSTAPARPAIIIAGVYREKASGARADRPELLRMIADLQPGEVVVAEKIDRISRLPLPEAERLVASIRAKGARLAVPGVVDFTDFAKATDAVTRIVLESVQELLLKLALQMARDDYETRRERHPVAPADEVRGQRQRQGRGDDHPDVAGGLAAHPAEWALHVPERRQNDRPRRAPGRAGFGVTEFSGVPAYTPNSQSKTDTRNVLVNHTRQARWEYIRVDPSSCRFFSPRCFSSRS